MRPRLLLVAPLPPPRGGVCTWTEILLASDVHARWAIRVVDTSPRGPLNQQPDRLYLQRLVPNARMLARTAGAMAMHRPEVAHVATNFGWSLWRTAAVVAALEGGGVPCVVHLHGGDFAALYERRPPAARRVLAAALRRASAVVAITQPTTQYLREALGVERAIYLPNFVDVDRFGRARASAGPRAGGFVDLLYVGWVMEGKGIFDLLDAVAAIPQIRLRVVGPWVPSGTRDTRELFWARVEERGLANRVVYVGEVPREDIASHYAAADVFVLPSHREGMPLAVLEAMAAGLPVVATRVGGVPEVIEDGVTGLLVPPRAPRALERALRRLASDVDLRRALGARAGAWARRTVAVPAVLERLEALWKEVARGPRR